MLNELGLRDLIRRALEEDIGPGDITTELTVPEKRLGRGVILAKARGVIAGLEVARLVFAELDSSLSFQAFLSDGDAVSPGMAVAEIKGRARSLLTGERVALNFLQRLSGIATATRELVELVRPYPVRVVDTRKTTPGLRALEKYAVRVGGGHNHRFGLYDAVLIKDNHIVAAGGLAAAVAAVRGQIPHTMTVEVEVETLEQLEEALKTEADIIMLDNMDPETLRVAVERVRLVRQKGHKVLLEASGGVSTENIVAIAQTGVDLISVGRLTHSVRALDLSLELEIAG